MAAGVAAGGAAGAVAAQQAVAEAIKASGALVRVLPRVFLWVLSKTPAPLVVMARSGILTTKYRYVTAYKGLVFFTDASAPLELPKDVELVVATKVLVPP